MDDDVRVARRVSELDVGVGPSDPADQAVVGDTLTVRRSADTSADQALRARTQRFLRVVPFYPVALAAYPVLRLYTDNIADVALRDVVMPLAVVVALTTIGLLMLGLAWRAPARAAIVVTAIAVPFMTYGLAADALASFWTSDPVLRAHLTAFVRVPNHCRLA